MLVLLLVMCFAVVLQNITMLCDKYDRIEVYEESLSWGIGVSVVVAIVGTILQLTGFAK